MARKRRDFTPRRPEYNVVVSEGPGHHWNRVGGAWLTDNGGFSIKLNPGVTLSWDDGLKIMMFSNEDTPPPADTKAQVA